MGAATSLGGTTVSGEPLDPRWPTEAIDPGDTYKSGEGYQRRKCQFHSQFQTRMVQPALWCQVKQRLEQEI